jgi:hypothetical protein
MLIRVKGKLEFEPENKTKKHQDQAEWKRVAMIRTYDDMDLYYTWFIRKRYNLEIGRPLRGSHVTIINDAEREAPNYDMVRSQYDGKEIEFFIDPSPRTNGDHWWLRVFSPASEEIRGQCGLNPQPYFNLHFTLGRAIIKYPVGVEENQNSSVMKIRKDYIEHSKYIHECVKRFESDVEPVRLPFNEYPIYEFKEPVNKC